jgi:hypothetical protein
MAGLAETRSNIEVRSVTRFLRLKGTLELKFIANLLRCTVLTSCHGNTFGFGALPLITAGQTFKVSSDPAGQARPPQMTMCAALKVGFRRTDAFDFVILLKNLISQSALCTSFVSNWGTGKCVHAGYRSNSQKFTNPHTANRTRELLRHYNWEVLDHPPDSPDLAPSDFYLFGLLKKHLGGRRFLNRR